MAEVVTARVRVRSFVVEAAKRFPPGFNGVVAHVKVDGGSVPLYMDDLRALLGDGEPRGQVARIIPADRNPGPDEKGLPW